MGWLNIREMVTYYTLIMTWKTLRQNTPQYLASKLSTNPDGTISTKNPRLQNTELALRWRMCAQWNNLSSQIRQINSLPRFKSATKAWIK